MSKIAPFFLTGANAKIKLNGKTLAFCEEVAYRVEIKHAAPVVLGMYEPSSVEPLAYHVTGSLTIIRYMRDVAPYNIDRGSSVPAGVDPEGNGVGNMSSRNILRRTIAGSDGKVHEAMDPKALADAVRFEIEIYQKLQDGPDGEKVVAPVARLRDCRITLADFRLNKKNPARQTFNFRAIYADEDSFTADMSGTGQQYA